MLASNVRRLRVAHRLSLSELARAAAMSKGTLSAIEHGRANPTVDTLTALANALHVSTAELLELPAVEEIRIVRAAQAEPSASDGTCLRALATVAMDGELELYELALPPRHVREVEPGKRSSRSHVLMLQGRLIAGPSERISELDVGDYASFPTDVSHVYEAGPAGARALMLAYTRHRSRRRQTGRSSTSPPGRSRRSAPGRSTRSPAPALGAGAAKGPAPARGAAAAR